MYCHRWYGVWGNQAFWLFAFGLALAVPVAAADEGASPGGSPPAISKEVQDALDALKESPETDRESQQKDRAEVAATHKQARSIIPLHDGQQISLRTYCLDESGDLWLCVGGDKGFLQRYSPDGELKREIPLDFVPTAINTAGGDFFVAGTGRMARVSRDGEVTATAPLPNASDPEELRKRLIEEAKAESQTVKILMEKNIARVEAIIEKTQKQIQELNDKGEEVPKSLSIRQGLYDRQLKSYRARLEKVEEPTIDAAEIDYLVSASQRVTAVAVTEQDVFVCCSGNGYEVWRMNHEFQDAKKVIENLSGCCGQMDIQAHGDQVLVAANTRFSVVTYDRDGKELSSFGKRNRESVDGFGSCCNPMNIRCCSNGDVLCAESSIGNIKRFSPSGELVGFIGKAKIGVGCKHVAIGYDESRDRYYMMNVDKGSIAVMVPLAEAPEFTEDELLAKAAMEGLGKKLIGEWHADTPEPNLNRTDEEKILALTRPDYCFRSIKFEPGGQLQVSGGLLGQYGNDLGWVPVSQTEKVLTISIQMSGADWLQFQVDLTNEGEMTMKSDALPPQKAQRVTAEQNGPSKALAE